MTTASSSASTTSPSVPYRGNASGPSPSCVRSIARQLTVHPCSVGGQSTTPLRPASPPALRPTRVDHARTMRRLGIFLPCCVAVVQLCHACAILAPPVVSSVLFSTPPPPVTTGPSDTPPSLHARRDKLWLARPVGSYLELTPCMANAPSLEAPRCPPLSPRPPIRGRRACPSLPHPLLDLPFPPPPSTEFAASSATSPFVSLRCHRHSVDFRTLWASLQDRLYSLPLLPHLIGFSFPASCRRGSPTPTLATGLLGEPSQPEPISHA